ncbi:MAG TPA: hypothetical protein VHD90_02645 [Phototrophicaceae bacterium]|nr:hypothetical protein [Phototrophicaceae bacterium]
MARLGTALATAIAIGFGLLTVWGLLSSANVPIANITQVILQLAVIMVAVTILLGVLNLFVVHLRRIGRRQKGWVYSFVLIVSAAAVIGLWITGQTTTNQFLLENVELSVESALAGLMVFALVFGAYRMMRRRVTWSAVLFTLVLLIILIGALPVPQVAFLASVRAWLLAVPVSAGARGILLGIALATVVTGVRVLIGQDRSYRE